MAAMIPFIQIRVFVSERQSVLLGNVINVENDLDICAQVLPCRFDEISSPGEADEKNAIPGSLHVRNNSS